MPQGRRDGDALASVLIGLDGAGYGKYKGISGSWWFDGFELDVRRVQPDPFAPASRFRVVVPAAVAALPGELCATAVRRRALGSFLLRALRQELAGSGVTVDAGGQEVLERSAVQLTAEGMVRVEVGVSLPGHGRRVAGRQCAALLTRTVPEAVHQSLRWESADRDAARRFVATVEDADALRGQLWQNGLVAFVADAAILPRRTGIDDRPLVEAVPFVSPESLRTTLTAPNAGDLTGMGVPEGVTLIVGGGYHGKSTLLRALESGVYDHVPGDGREFSVTRPDAVKIRAEDERSVERVDVSAFVTVLPSGQPTDDFSTTNASGSTSQAASTMEALEAGASVLLIDEDTSATNVMIRDGRMQRLISREREPLVPFVERVRPLYEARDVSTILVMGGSGDYLDKADTVIMMDAYVASEVTERAHSIATAEDTPLRSVEHTGFPHVADRVFDPFAIDPSVRGKRRITARGRNRLTFGGEDIDLAAVEQVVDSSQVTGIGLALAHAVESGLIDGERTLAEVLAALERDFAEDGVDGVAHGSLSDFALPRRHEIAAALNRLRTARVRHLRRDAADRAAGPRRPHETSHPAF